MITQTDIVIAVRVITTVREDETPEDVRERLHEQVTETAINLEDSIQQVRTDVVDRTTGGESVTTTVVLE